MIVYIDNNYKCHLNNEDSFREVETDFFDGKCPSFIEGYRYVPSNESWIREDGTVFVGEMITPWKSYSTLVEAQSNYEDGINSQDEIIAELMNEITSLCEELIGE